MDNYQNLSKVWQKVSTPCISYHKKMKKTIILFVCLMSSVLLLAQDVESFVNKQLETYPQSRLLDIYKSCFQDYMGAEHLVADRQSVKAYLDQELETTNVDALMPWHYEFCGIDGNYVRVSLKVIKENLITKDMLLDAFIRSANERSSEHHPSLPENGRVVTDECEANGGKRPSVESWRERWNVIIGVIDQMGVNLPDYTKDKLFLDSILSISKYAISHSPEYREAYRPHYRIVERGIFEKEIKPLLESKMMVVRMAEIEVYPQYLEEYLKAARNVGAKSVEKEPGVICIFPNQVKEGENKFRIIEIYRNKEAYEHHLTTEHFQAYKQGTLHMVKSLRLVDVSPLDVNSMPMIFNKLK